MEELRVNESPASPLVGLQKPSWRCGRDPREGLECWLGFWKAQEASNSARLGAPQAASLSFLTVRHGEQAPHFTAEKSQRRSSSAAKAHAAEEWNSTRV